MSEYTDKYVERMDMVERGMLEAEDEQVRGRLTWLEADLAELERIHRETVKQTLLGNIIVKLAEYNELTQSEVKHLGRYATARNYGKGERPGATSAALIWPSCENSEVLLEMSRVCLFMWLTRWLIGSDNIILTSLAPELRMINRPHYLTHITMTWQTDLHREWLMAPSEIVATLRDMLSGMVQGMDGLMVSFYKANQDKLVPHMVILFEEMVRD
ncbi:hypothetical protein NDU88_002340 [Pleurodeles waltl]|uniref:Uncharacterized protein n=1 Tax=Pleurodeles waltl TaxID=8319 RepID=A0AAV7NF47_PLEWA|nr:hypothetical protein NDU88_002340 [Pleurodeles waltl]